MWSCVCGFHNKPANRFCGGTGPMGCKLPNPDPDAMVSGGGYGPAKGQGKGHVVPLAFRKRQIALQAAAAADGNADVEKAGADADAGGYPGNMSANMSTPYGVTGPQWQCSACGFTNRGANSVCGGFGPMGCNAPQGLSTMKGAGKGESSGLMDMLMGVVMGMPSMGAMGKGKAKGKADGGWACKCGFRNNYSNDVCGGNGPMGCKEPKPLGAFGAGFRGWECGDCGFQNKGTNSQCGGTGPMGCNAARPADWACDACGFVNKNFNTVCGGEGGKVGCKAPKPEAANAAEAGPKPEAEALMAELAAAAEALAR